LILRPWRDEDLEPYARINADARVREHFPSVLSREESDAEAARTCVEYAFGELGLRELVAFTVLANKASRRVMEKLGMRHSPEDDFEHPDLPPGHPLRQHVLYRLSCGVGGESPG
jgi:RimJ/RimL family protein N-acetyltransferase